MSFEPVAQLLLFGVFVGALYGVAAVGLALVFGVMRVLNVAHGELLMLGGYVTFWLFTLWRVDPFVSLLAAVPILFGVGLVLNTGLFSHVVRLDEESKIKNSLLIALTARRMRLGIWLRVIRTGCTTRW